MAPRSGSLQLADPYPKLIENDNEPFQLGDIKVSDDAVEFEDGVMKVRLSDGSVEFDTEPEPDSDFDSNLARQMAPADLAQVATNLLDGITRDDQSRKEWLETRALGITLLGLKLEKARADAGTSGAPLEGMATVRHPMLLEATVAFQSTARAELLPASGPVKVRNDTPMAPLKVLTQQAMATNAMTELADSQQSNDYLAEALEKDINHYLTVTASEYVPDTDRMLFYIGFGGDGFKKVYNCPLRQRPVSESIDAEDLIVSNAATDIRNCARVTHRIKMRRSVLKRMQILGVYRDVELTPPAIANVNVVDKKKEEIAGITSQYRIPEDRDYEIYECYCELDIDQFAPKAYRGKGLPLPYRVTVEKDSRQILDIRRNWDDDDEQCMAKHYFVQFPFIRGLGFYGLGYIHLLGNTTNALTAAWRLQLDNGMFANFPAGMIAKGLGRQNTSNLRAAPGTLIPIDIGGSQRIQDAVMPLPYKETGPAFSTFIQHVEEVGQRLASTGTINVGEGKQEAPVGTTLALIEQATKIIDSAHKRLHAAQAEEFALLKQRFLEDPEALWRHNKRTTVAWQKDQFIQALNNVNLVPVADPNNPTSLHRLAKAMAIKTLQQGNPALYDAVAVDMRVMRIADIDPTGLFNLNPPPPPPDPRVIAIQTKAQSEAAKTDVARQEVQLKASTSQQQFADKAEERASRERLAQLKLDLEKLRLQEESIIHAHDAQREDDAAMRQHEMDTQVHQQELQTAAAKTDAAKATAEHKRQTSQIDAASKLAELGHRERQNAMQPALDQQNHAAEMQRAQDTHMLNLQQSNQAHAAKMQQMTQPST